jgi:hypothetical protein
VAMVTTLSKVVKIEINYLAAMAMIFFTVKPATIFLMAMLVMISSTAVWVMMNY